MVKRRKGHDRESNTGLEGHSLSRYHCAAYGILQPASRTKLEIGDRVPKAAYAIVAMRTSVSMAAIDERRTVRQNRGHLNKMLAVPNWKRIAAQLFKITAFHGIWDPWGIRVIFAI